MPLTFQQWLNQRWPHPYGRDYLGSDPELIPPLAERLRHEAIEMYRRHLHDELRDRPIDWWARAKQDNPLPASAMDCGANLTALMNVNFRFLEFHRFMRDLELDEWHVSNYEPYWLTLLMQEHQWELDTTQEDMYRLYVNKFWLRMADSMPIPFRSYMVAPMPPPKVE